LRTPIAPAAEKGRGKTPHKVHREGEGEGKDVLFRNQGRNGGLTGEASANGTKPRKLSESPTKKSSERSSVSP